MRRGGSPYNALSEGCSFRLSRSAASSLGSKEPRIVAFEQYGRGLEGPRAAQHISSPLVRPRAGRPSPRTPTHPGPRAAALRAFWCRSPPGPPSSLEPIIRLEAMIDARIDKALARLVSLQEYERVRATSSPAKRAFLMR